MVRRAAAGIAHHVGAGVLDHHLAVFVIQVDDRRRGRVQAVEEQLLAAEVLREGAVVVEVVVGQVGEDGHAEFQAGDPLLFDADGTDLHEAIGAAGLHHVGEQGVEGHRIGGRIGGLAAPGPDIVGDGGEQAALVAQAAEQVVQQGHGRGLAVRSRDAHEFQFSARMAVVGVRRQRNRLPAVGDCHDRDSLRQGGFHPLHPLEGLVHHRDGAVFNGFSEIFAAVVPASVHGNEEAAGPDLAGVVGQRGDLHVRVALDGENVTIPYDLT